MKDPQIYILSTGRSGSTFFSKVFVQKCLDQAIGHQKEGSRILNIVSNIPGVPPKAFSGLLSFFDRGYPPESTSDPLLSMTILKLINSSKIDGKIIHLVRDPRTFVESFMNWKSQSLRKQFLHHCVPFWNPVPYLEDPSIRFKQWLQMSKFEKFCWVWNYKNSLFYKLDRGRNNYLLIRLEDLTDTDENKRKQEFAKLVDFLEVSFKKGGIDIQSKVNASKKDYFPPYKNWSDEQQDILIKHCGELAKQLGYQI